MYSCSPFATVFCHSSLAFSSARSLTYLKHLKFTDISKHPELQWLLMTAVGSGKVQHHPYIKPPNSKRKKNKVSDAIAKIYPHISQDEINLLLSINDNDELKQFFQAHAYTDKEIKEILK